MSPSVGRGRRIYLAFAVLLIAEELITVGFALSHGLAEVKWWQSVARPLLFSLGVFFLWEGDDWLRWLVSVACLVTGGVAVVVAARVLFKLAEVTPPGEAGFLFRFAGVPIGIVAVVGLSRLLAGLAFLLSPSVRAFFRHQRVRRSGGITESD